MSEQKIKQKKNWIQGIGKLKINDFDRSNSDDDDEKNSKDKNIEIKSRNQITVLNKLNFKRSKSNIDISSRG